MFGFVRELRRNPALMLTLGFELRGGFHCGPAPGGYAAPSDSAFCRFCQLLIEIESEIDALTRVFHAQVDELAQLSPDFGQRTGHTLHVHGDVQHELPSRFRLAPANESEYVHCEELIKECEDLWFYGRCESFVADRGLDSNRIRKRLFDKDILPVIDSRRMWQDKNPHPERLKVPTRPLNAADGVDAILHTENGVLYCECPCLVKTAENRLFDPFSTDSRRFPTCPRFSGSGCLEFARIDEQQIGFGEMRFKNSKSAPHESFPRTWPETHCGRVFTSPPKCFQRKTLYKKKA